MKRVLHVLGAMNYGGVETWLMHVLRAIDKERFQLDFLVHTDRPAVFDSEIRSLGSNLLCCGAPSRPWKYIPALRGLLGSHGPYDVVHSHVHHFSGLVLKIAAQAGVAQRISHSHTDTSRAEAKAGWLRRVYLRTMARWVDQYATLGLAASQSAAEALYGRRWRDDGRWRLLFCAIDLSPFERKLDRQAIRAELGIAPEAYVIGHVGRFADMKNHAFFIDVFAELARLEPDTMAVFLGEGPLREDMRMKADRLGLSKRILFQGTCSDVPRVLMGAVDLFLFPSIYEGLPIAVIEAQAAGLPCVISDSVSGEVDQVEPLIHRLSLKDGARRWAQVLGAIRRKPVPLTRAQALEILRRSSFDIDTSIRIIEDLYWSGEFPQGARLTCRP